MCHLCGKPGRVTRLINQTRSNTLDVMLCARCLVLLQTQLRERGDAWIIVQAGTPNSPKFGSSEAPW